MDLDQHMMTVGVLRELLRNIEQFRAIYADHGVDILMHDGEEYCLWDLEAILEECDKVLPPRQKQAIQLCLVRNMRESDAALQMGIFATNPVASYATTGLAKIVDRFNKGLIHRRPHTMPRGA